MSEKPEIKLPTYAGSQKKLGNSRKTSTSGSFTVLNPFTVWITTYSVWNSLKEMGIPGHISCLLRNLYAGQDIQSCMQQLELDMEQ